jgi:hypothetical protein
VVTYLTKLGVESTFLRKRLTIVPKNGQVGSSIDNLSKMI